MSIGCDMETFRVSILLSAFFGFHREQQYRLSPGGPLFSAGPKPNGGSLGDISPSYGIYLRWDFVLVFSKLKFDLRLKAWLLHNLWWSLLCFSTWSFQYRYAVSFIFLWFYVYARFSALQPLRHLHYASLTKQQATRCTAASKSSVAHRVVSRIRIPLGWCQNRQVASVTKVFYLYLSHLFL